MKRGFEQAQIEGGNIFNGYIHLEYRIELQNSEGRSIVNTMKRTFSFVVAISLIFTFIFSAVTPVEAYSYRARGYTRSNGTYVNSYYKTSPNYSKWDNYSTRGNYNPYSGRYGTKNPW